MYLKHTKTPLFSAIVWVGDNLYYKVEIYQIWGSFSTASIRLASTMSA